MSSTESKSALVAKDNKPSAIMTPLKMTSQDWDSWGNNNDCCRARLEQYIVGRLSKDPEHLIVHDVNFVAFVQPDGQGFPHSFFDLVRSRNWTGVAMEAKQRLQPASKKPGVLYNYWFTTRDETTDQAWNKMCAIFAAQLDSFKWFKFSVADFMSKQPASDVLAKLVAIAAQDKDDVRARSDIIKLLKNNLEDAKNKYRAAGYSESRKVAVRNALRLLRVARKNDKVLDVASRLDAHLDDLETAAAALDASAAEVAGDADISAAMHASGDEND
jgi:hypothetical protein